MPPFNPIQFVRTLVNGRQQLAGNRVQLEDTTGTAIASGNALPVTLETATGGLYGDVNLSRYGGAVVGPANPVDVEDTWGVVLVADEDANDSDKTYTFPANYLYQILNIRVELATTATVGARQLAIQLRDASDDVIGEWRPRITQAASLTYIYEFAPGLAQDTAIYDTDLVTTPIPPTLIVLAGYDLRIYDNNAIDAAADDMVIQLLLARKPA